MSVGRLLCRLGIHDWSNNRGGIKICERKECEKAKTYGVSGAYRRLEFQRTLYNKYQEYNEENDS